MIAIPGANAAITALTVSGMPTDRFVFEGFLPNKTAARKKQLLSLKAETRTIIIYESPHRLLKSLSDIKETLGDIELVIAREITKKFEEIKRGKTVDLIEHFTMNKPRGEFVLVFNF